jgi:hypothetical protein
MQRPLASRVLVECQTVAKISMYGPIQAIRGNPVRTHRNGLHRHRRYPGDGDWTRLFSDVVGPQGRVFSFVQAEIADLNPDQVGRMQTLAKEPGRENIEAVSADLVAMPEVTQPDILWLHACMNASD